jgi:hypothetical protein
MTITESRSADRKKVRFPPPKAWDPEAKWTQECVISESAARNIRRGSETRSRNYLRSRD